MYYVCYMFCKGERRDELCLCIMYAGADAAKVLI